VLTRRTSKLHHHNPSADADELDSRVASLEAELESLKHVTEIYKQSLETANSEIAELRAANVRLEL
jgi:hypothetical protein